MSTESSFARARRDAGKAFHSIWLRLTELFIGAGLSIWVLLWNPNFADRGNPIVLYRVLVPLGGILAGLLAFFLVMWYWAPYRQRNEARASLSQLEVTAKADDLRISNSQIAESLSVFYAEATKLMMREIKTDDDLNSWNTEVEDWQKRTLGWVEGNLSITDARLLARTTAVRTMAFERHYNEFHNNRLTFLYYRSTQLETLISRHQT